MAVVTPPHLHAEMAVAALQAGKHVFCETPLALDLGEARQMRDAARHADRLLQVGLLMLYDHQPSLLDLPLFDRQDIPTGLTVVAEAARLDTTFTVSVVVSSRRRATSRRALST